MRKTGLVTIAAATLAMTACGGGGQTDGPDGSTTSMATATQVATALAEAQCDLVARCVPEAIDLYGGEHCIEGRRKRIEDTRFAVIDELAEAGLAAFDGEVAADCIAALESLTCSDFETAPPAPCRDMMVGTVRPGEPCTSDYACAGDAWCDTSDACPGVCRSMVGLGESCGDLHSHSSDVACLEGACVGGMCQRMPVAGERCLAGDQCAFGLMCDSGTCRDSDDYRTASRAEPCNVAAEPPVLCSEGLFCSKDAADEQAICRSEADSGGSCPMGYPDICPAGEYCSFDYSLGEGTCQPQGREGEACETTSSCADGLHCSDGTCVENGRIGDSCTADMFCYSGYCDGGTCVVPVGCAP